MRIPDLEDMIQQAVEQVLQQQVTGNYICEDCQRPLTEHTLIPQENPSCEIYVCCYPDNLDQRFKPSEQENVDWTALADTLRTMLHDNQREDRNYYSVL